MRSRPRHRKVARLSPSLAHNPDTAGDLGTHAANLFADYHPSAKAFDELFEKQTSLEKRTPRSKWKSVLNELEAIAPADRTQLWHQADEFVRENGVTYNAFSEEGVVARPWEIDLFPVVFSEVEWLAISDGLIQRTRLLDAIVRDIYGDQKLLKSGAIPPEIVFSHPGFHRPFCDLPRPQDSSIAMCGYELARSPKGSWYVMADRFDAPAGAGYALENRLAVSRTLPHAIQRTQVQRLAPFFLTLLSRLRSLAFRNTTDPRIVILTGGPSQSTYFEDVFLARYLGLFLVEGGDLAVRDDDVFIKTVDGFLAVDVIFNRIRESDIDALEVIGGGAGGVAGIVNAVRQKRVAMTNSLGAGIAESPVWMPFLRGLCRELLGEDLILPSIATWWCGAPQELKYVLEHLDELVIKPAFEYSGGHEDIVALMSAKQRDDLIAEIKRRPADFVAQERITRSVAPSWSPHGITAGYHAFRTFVTADELQRNQRAANYEAMPGALVRVADDSAPMQLSISAGQRSKDAWVLSSEPVTHVTLLAAKSRAVSPRRNAHLVPCRIADNLFWFGRTLDTLDVDARLMRAILDRIESDRATDEIPEIPSLLRALVGSDLLEPEYAVGELAQNLPPLEEAIVGGLLSYSRPGSIRSELSELSRIASNSRDRISPDTWQAVRQIDESFVPIDTSRTPNAGECLNMLDDLLVGLAACSGMITDGMVRGAAWRFCRIGRLLGRAERTVTLIRHAWPRSNQDGAPVLDALLEVMDGRITYRSRYLADLHPRLVLDLLVFDETNPRSLAFQLTQLAKEIHRLPKSPTEVGLNASQTAILRATSELHLCDAERLVAVPAADQQRDSLETLLDRQAEYLKETSLAIVRGYLVLSRGAKQREEGVVRLS